MEYFKTHYKHAFFIAFVFTLLFSSFLTTPIKAEEIEVQFNVNDFPTKEEFGQHYLLIFNYDDNNFHLYLTRNGRGGTNDIGYVESSNRLRVTQSYEFISSDSVTWTPVINTAYLGSYDGDVGYPDDDIKMLYWSTQITKMNSSNQWLTTVAFMPAPVPDIAPLRLATDKAIVGLGANLTEVFGTLLVAGLAILSTLLVVQLVRELPNSGQR